MRLDLFEEDIAVGKAEAKLHEALRMWIEGVPYCDDPELSFRAESALLKERAKA